MKLAMKLAAKLAAKLVALLVALFVAGCVGTTRRELPLWERPGLQGAVRPEMGHPQPGDVAPDFELPDGKGGIFRSSALRGSWVVLHFTASWCPFCDAEVAHLGELAADYRARGVQTVLIDVKEDEARWAEYSKAHVPSTLVALRDASGDVAQRFAPPHAQPSFTDRASVVLDCTLILDPQGVIRLFLMPDSKHFDPTFGAVRGELDRMLLEAASAPVAEPAPLAPEEVVVIAQGKGDAGEAHEVVVTLHVAAGYHLMSDRPSAPEYIATRVSLADADGLTWGAPRYPPPVTFSLADRQIATFQGDVEVHVPFTLAAGAAPGARTIDGTVRYQSCTATRCLFPVTRALQVHLQVGAP